MPIPTPFHPRTSALCTSYRWKQWAGYYAVCSYEMNHEREYFAFRHAAGLLDVSPLYKYDVGGRDAAAFLSRVMARDVRKLKVGQVGYCCWCNEEGYVLDDGTVTRLDDTRVRVTAAEPALAWLDRNRRGFDVALEDVSERIATLALQGPNSREILKQVCGADVERLKFFRATATKLDGLAAVVTRTGYTGDLGYEVWVARDDALALWDALVAAGKPYGLEPAGLDALDVTRVEAGFILNGVDYFGARDCVIPSQKSTPYEIGLGGTVHLDRDPFVGQEALKREVARGSEWAFVGLEIKWDEMERLYDSFGLPPHLPATAWRTAVPVYANGKQVGQATSGTWSPLLKRNLALASLRTPHAKLGTPLEIEHTIEYQRRTLPATVVEKPFFDPERKRA
ncbi:MAG: aminomethyl transferase family protein [Planctomycetes bacterium]|nr:aminomethyl transferase family protein [Planctomycetota bacterium]